MDDIAEEEAADRGNSGVLRPPKEPEPEPAIRPFNARFSAHSWQRLILWGKE